MTTDPAPAEVHAEVLVLGSGPGGYTAAFRAADLGKRVALVERYPTLGGVCLNVGCIPSKALLHLAGVIEEARAARDHGIGMQVGPFDLEKIRAFVAEAVGKLTVGLAGLAKRRDVQVITGTGQFISDRELRVAAAGGSTRIRFEQAIIAAGSRAVKPKTFPFDDPRVMDSTGALALDEIPARLLIVGGGVIGLEMARIYSALGSQITIVEMLAGLMTGCDRDLVRPLHRQIERLYDQIFLETEVTGVELSMEGLQVALRGAKAPAAATFDRILVAVGRAPNGHDIGAGAAGVAVDPQGFIPVDAQLRTNVPHIFAIGDITRGPMLAHRASHQGKTAAEVVAGEERAFAPRVIPSVAYTDPEVAWVGLTEQQAEAQGVTFGRGSFPWSASGRALSMGRNRGLTKLLFEEGTGRLLGAGIVGPHAGELIAEVALAIEMGADAQDIGLTIHPHPTLSETVAFSAEVFTGSITDLYNPIRRADPS